MKAEAKKRLTQFVNSLFAVVLVVGLLPTWALSNPQQAYAAPADYTVTAMFPCLQFVRFERVCESCTIW